MVAQSVSDISIPMPENVDRQQTIALLQETIQNLQNVVVSLEKSEIQVSTESVEILLKDTAAIAQQLQPIPATEPEPSTEDWDDLITETTPIVPPPAPKPRPIKSTAKIPQSRQKTRRPNWLQIGIGAVAAIVVAIALFLKFSATPPEMAQTEPTINDPIETIEPVEPIAPPVAPEPESPVIVTQPPPEPEKILTPEQRLVAAIQTQITEVTQPYGDNIVRTIQADFSHSKLNITVGDAWYLLKPGLQDRLGRDVLNLAHLLDFKKLIVRDLDNRLVAREPLVGNELIILQRYQEFKDNSDNSDPEKI